MTDVAEVSKWASLMSVKGTGIYAVPLIAFVFGLMGIGIIKLYKLFPLMVKPYLYVAGTFCILLQTIFIGIDLSQYERFWIFDGPIYPFVILGRSSTYSSVTIVAWLAVPCVGIILSHLYLLYAWIRFDGTK